MLLSLANSFNNLTSSFNRAASVRTEENNQDRQTISFKNRKERMSDLRRLQRDKNEAAIREREDVMMNRIKEKIVSISTSDLDFESRGNLIEALEFEIEQILTHRANREEERLQLELKERELEIEIERREAEKEREEMHAKLRSLGSDTQDSGAALRNEDIRNFVQISVSLESINALRQSRARMAVEAGHLEREINSEPNGNANLNDFRNTHLGKLKEGMVKIDAAIDSEIGKMNDNARSWSENRNQIVENADDESIDLSV